MSVGRHRFLRFSPKNWYRGDRSWEFEKIGMGTIGPRIQRDHHAESIGRRLAFAPDGSTLDRLNRARSVRRSRLTPFPLGRERLNYVSRPNRLRTMLT